MSERQKTKKPLEWKEAVTLKGEQAVRGALPAVRLTYTQTRKLVLFSHTPGIIENEGAGSFIPTMHLRDAFIAQYLPMLEKSARLAASIRVRWDEKTGRERLAASVGAILLSKERD